MPLWGAILLAAWAQARPIARLPAARAPGRTAVAPARLPSTGRARLPSLSLPRAAIRVPSPDAPLSAVGSRLLREFHGPPELLRAHGIKWTVAVFGSARVPEGSPFYEEARRFARLVIEKGRGRIAVVTGGGPGIMEAANRGALEAGGPSVGYNIKLDKEQGLNAYVTPGLSMEFDNFSTRKMALRHGAVSLAFFPGGYGTLDELFEILTLIQTRKMKPVPIVLVGGRRYWDRVFNLKTLLEEGMISPADLELFRYADNAEDAWAGISEAMAPPDLPKPD